MFSNMILTLIEGILPTIDGPKHDPDHGPKHDPDHGPKHTFSNMIPTMENRNNTENGESLELGKKRDVKHV